MFEVSSLKHLQIMLHKDFRPAKAPLTHWDDVRQPFTLLSDVGHVDNSGVKPGYAQYLKKTMECPSRLEQHRRMRNALEHLETAFHTFEFQRQDDYGTMDDSGLRSTNGPGQS